MDDRPGGEGIPGGGRSAASPADIAAICARFGSDRHRLLDILLDVQHRFRWISPETATLLAACLGLTRVEVEGVASFYSFLSDTPRGRITIRLCADIVDRFAGLAAVTRAFEDALGIAMGETTPDGAFSLEYTPCIGLCDQAPAAMVEDVVITRLTPDKARTLMAALKDGQTPQDVAAPGWPALSPYERARAMVDNNIRLAGDVLLGPVPREAGLKKALAGEPFDIIDTIEASGLRGCGGAGFATEPKWRIAAGHRAEAHYVFCNADEGEPGTFKDRVLLTERPHLLVEGMTIAARAIGAREGLIYLRGEYAYLRPHLEAVLAERRSDGLLGRAIMGVADFDFDIRIQMGAGAYMCGEEGALINSSEGLRGEPRTRPPYPVTCGYFGHPTVVNNVETFCHAARIMDRGAEWFFALGQDRSHGTKLFSISGDVERPGVYELPYGRSIQELLALAGGEHAEAVQVGGPSGEMIGRDSFHRRLTFDDLPSGGAIIVFSGARNVLEIVEYYMGFFVEESCGYCTPCRVGNVFLHKAIGKFRQGLANPSDIEYLRDLSQTIVETSRCGLGTTSPRPILSTLDAFPLVYSALAKPCPDRVRATFDIQSAIDDARTIARRRSSLYDRDYSQ